MPNADAAPQPDFWKKFFSWLSNLRSLTWALGIVCAPLFTQEVRGAFAKIWQIPYAKLLGIYYATALLGLALYSGYLTFRLKKALIKAADEELTTETRVVLPSYVQEYIAQVADDTSRSYYPYDYSSVEHEVHIDKHGNYTATYTHEFTNDGRNILLDYWFDIRTTQRARFEELKTRALVTINGGVEQGAKTRSAVANEQSEHHHRVTVRLPQPLPGGSRCRVSLAFTWPKAVQMSGQDGDAFDLNRFKILKRASMALTFENPVYSGFWFWNRGGPDEIFPHQPEPISTTSYKLILPCEGEALTKAIYAFTGTLEGIDDQQAA